MHILLTYKYLNDSKRCKFAFQGQEAETELYGEGNASFFKFRISDNRLGRFFAIDPLSAKYPYNSPYAFSENRVNDAIELEGLETFPIHGTWGNNSAWTPLITNNIQNIFGNTKTNIKTLDDYTRDGKAVGWDGFNKSKNREQAARDYVTYIKANRIAGEPITIIGHSHGGNVGILVMNMLSEDPEFNGVELNLVTLNTPVRKDYQLSKNAIDRVNHYQIWNDKDPVQVTGGNFVDIGSGTNLISGELGKAGRTFDYATNIQYTPAFGFANSYHTGWDSRNVNVWLPQLQSAVSSCGGGYSPYIDDNSSSNEIQGAVNSSGFDWISK